MSRHSSGPLRSTLGFFHQGFPVVFIKNDVLFRSPDYGDEYLKLIGEDGAAKPGVPFDDNAARAFHRYSTVIHELRHFHDALLCRPLFEQFLRQQKISLAILQILNRLAKLRHLPNKANDAIWSSDPELADLKQLVDDADEDAFERSTGLYESGMIENDSITLDHLLEASATIAELLHLHAVHGVEAMEFYYRSVVLKADRLYTLLIERFVAIHDGILVRGVDSLYCALAISLYSSENPVARFVSIYSAFRADAGKIRAEVESWFANQVPREDDLARRISGERLVHRDSGEPIDLSRLEEHEFPLNELVSLHHTLYDARRTLIQRYVQNARCRADFYIEHLHETHDGLGRLTKVEETTDAGIATTDFSNEVSAYPISPLTPNITTISPASGPPGTVITLAGTFGPFFPYKTYPLFHASGIYGASWTDTTVSFQVPTNTTGCNVNVASWRKKM